MALDAPTGDTPSCWAPHPRVRKQTVAFCSGDFPEEGWAWLGQGHSPATDLDVLPAESASERDWGLGGKAPRVPLLRLP